MKNLVIFLTVAGLAFAAQAQTSKNVLFVGNSYTSVNNLPQMVADIAVGMGDTLTYQSSTPGGCTFMQHCQNQSMTLIRQGGWDAVVLQEQSQYPSFPDGQVASEVMPYAARLVDSIYAASPCAEPMFYMTWGRKNGDQQNAVYFPPLGTYEGMDSLLALRYRQMADANDASLCPVGRVWHRLRDEHPEIELYQSDGSHPSVAGTYATACAFYTLLFHNSPDAIGFNATLDAATASIIRHTVRTIVYDSLDRWQRPLPEIELLWTDTTQSVSESFTLTTSHADSLSVDWGDGSDTILLPAGVTTLYHTYPTAGSYTVSLVASRHCMETRRSWTFTSSGTQGIDGNGTLPPTPAIAPNPASGHVLLTFPQLPHRLEVATMEGKTIGIYTPDCTTFTLDVTNMPTGIYLMRTYTDGIVVTRRLAVIH